MKQSTLKTYESIAYSGWHSLAYNCKAWGTADSFCPDPYPETINDDSDDDKESTLKTTNMSSLYRSA